MSDDSPLLDTVPLDTSAFATSFTPPPGLRVLVGGVGELFQTDLDLGRLVVNDLMEEQQPRGVFVEDLSYGALPFTHRLMELQPQVLVLVGAVEREREPGSIVRRRVVEVDRTPEELQAAVGDAYTGYVHLDLTTDVAYALDLLPRRTIVIEVEPGRTGPGDQLTDVGRASVEPLKSAVRREVALSPLLELSDQLRPRLDLLDPSDIRHALQRLFDQLTILEDEGRWAATFQAKDDLRLAISGGLPSGRMDHADWGMMWGIIEELTRLQARTVTEPDL